MAAPCRRRRRSSYSDRAHDVATKPQTAVATTAVPGEIDWRIRPGELVAHAFSTAPGWMRSVCRHERWTVLLQDAPDDAEPCPDCALLVDGAPGEITEAYGS